MRIVLSFLLVSFFIFSSDDQQVVKNLVESIKNGNKKLFDTSLQKLSTDSRDVLVSTSKGYVANLVEVACAVKGEHTSYFIKSLIDNGCDPHKISEIYHDHTCIVDYEFFRFYFTWKDKVAIRWLPLDIAIFVGNVSAVKTLLACNVDPEKSAINYNPSMIAKWLGESALEHAKLYKCLNRSGQSVSFASKEQLAKIIKLLEKKVKENRELDADLRASSMQLCGIL